MNHESYLTPAQARKFYDRMGKRQDWQRIYEGRAITELLNHGEFSKASAVFELGCGTGVLAEKLLGHYLPPEATYIGVDISPVMVALSRARLSTFGDRVKIYQSNGEFDFNQYTSHHCDRFLAVYVLDLLPPDDINQVLEQAHKLLQSQGKLCLVSLTEGCTKVSQAIVSLWKKVKNINPQLVGGCRPLHITPYISKEHWQIEFDKSLSVSGVPSEIVVASKLKINNTF